MCWFVIVELFQGQVDQGDGGFGVFVVGFGFFVEIGVVFFQVFQIGEYEFGFNCFQIGQWVDFVGDMGDVVIIEIMQYIGDGVGFVDIGEELVVQVFVFGCVCYQVGNVDEVYVCWQDFFGLGDFGQFGQVWFWYSYIIDIWFDGVEWIICCLGCSGLCQSVEEC